MNKYQEALKRLQEETTPNPYTLNHNDEDFKVLQELVDKTKIHILEEVKKKGEVKMTSKPKLNQPDVESTITSPIGESLNINFTIPSKQFEQVFEKDTNIEKRNLTLEAVKKEWEELGYEWKEDTDHFFLTKDVLSIISFKKSEKCYYANHRINRIVHKIITKTFKALGWM